LTADSLPIDKIPSESFMPTQVYSQHK